MKRTRNLVLCFLTALLLFQCRENELIDPKITDTKSEEVAEEPDAESDSERSAAAATNSFYVSINGNDATGDGSQAKPWRSVRYAVSRTLPDRNQTVRIGAGTFVESGLIEVPTGVNIEGAGRAITIIKAASSFYYNPVNPEYAFDKFLMRLKSESQSNGNQSLKNFAINGDSKKLHGGIYIRQRNNITIEGIKVEYANYTGVWLWDVNNSKMKNNQIFNSGWGSTSYCSGALNLGNLNQVEIDNLEVNENTGYGIKAIGPNSDTNISGLKIYNSHISVSPNGLWNNGSAPNIAIELWKVNISNSEIYQSYVDNTISLVNSNNNIAPTGKLSIRVHHNTIDMETRARGAGYGIELTLHDAEIDHNYFLKGTQGIANWDNAKRNWSIHHNVFYAIQGTWPGEVLRAQSSGLHNVKFFNNTIEFDSDKTANVIGLYGGQSEDVFIQNNLLINSNTRYSYYPNSLIHMENGATLNTLQVKNNLFDRLPVGTVPGTYANNQTVNPQIKKTGDRADQYYIPLVGSPLIDRGLNLGSISLPIFGSAPDIGAFEYVRP
jgi:parallel beta-helix repeat protein